MTPDDHYRIGSTTKTFTAVVTLQLVAEGRLRLNDTLATRLPDLTIPQAGLLTVEHLLRMRSGLFDFEDAPALAGNLAAHRVPVTLAQAVSLGIQHQPLFAPGSQYRYCNTNFCLLEILIERITGGTLEEAFAERIFTPLGLTQTRYPHETDLSLPEPYIRGYERTADGWDECSEVFFGRGDGAIISTARDVARFFRALLVEQTLLPADLLHKAMTVAPDDPTAEDDYGLGLMTYRLPCGTLWGHAGGGYGYGHMPYLLVETGRFAVIMLNGSYGFHAQADPTIPPRPPLPPGLQTMLYC